MLQNIFADDFFGDRFTLTELPLPRKASGYAVQMLGTDTLLDQKTANFLSIRTAQLNGLFASFEEAHAAASDWVNQHCSEPEEHQLAIVPASFDHERQRHILIYGVLRGQP